MLRHHLNQNVSRNIASKRMAGRIRSGMVDGTNGMNRGVRVEGPMTREERFQRRDDVRSVIADMRSKQDSRRRASGVELMCKKTL